MRAPDDLPDDRKAGPPYLGLCTECGERESVHGVEPCECGGTIYPFRQNMLLRLHFARDAMEPGAGTTVVASGVLFWDGTVVVMWDADRDEAVNTERNGVYVYPGETGLEDARKVHSDDANTRVIWEDDPVRGDPE